MIMLLYPVGSLDICERLSLHAWHPCKNLDPTKLSKNVTRISRLMFRLCCNLRPCANLPLAQSTFYTILLIHRLLISDPDFFIMDSVYVPSQLSFQSQIIRVTFSMRFSFLLWQLYLKSGRFNDLLLRNKKLICNFLTFSYF